MRFLHGKNVEWRGHTVVYPAEIHMPSYLKKLVGKPWELRQAVLKHVGEVCGVVKKYDKRCVAVDTVNEPRGAGRYLFEKTDLVLEEEVFRVARSVLGGGVRLFVNDFGVLDKGGVNKYGEVTFYHEWLQRMKGKGVPVEGIGFQGHFKVGQLTHPQRIFEIIQNFGVYGGPVQITEFDLETTDEGLLADFTRDVLIAAFSAPACDAFVFWGFWAGEQWRPNAAMFRKDWSKKKNYYAYKNLLFAEWWSNFTTNANNQGYTVNRVFKGQYNIMVEVGGKQIYKDIYLSKAKEYHEIKVNVEAAATRSAVPRSLVAYPGQEPNAPWRKAAQDRINKYRKGILKIYVQYPNGQKAVGAKVKVKMLRHKFVFASYIGHKFLDKSDPNHQRRQSTFKELFNGATVPIYWANWGWYSPSTQKYYIEAMKYMRQNYIPYKVSPMIAPSEDSMPKAILQHKGNWSAMRGAVLQHVRDVAGTIRAHNPVAVDMVNHPSSSNFLKQNTGNDIYTQAFQETKKKLPKAKLVLDEHQILNAGGSNMGQINKFHKEIETLKAQNIGLSGIGFQGHFNSLTDPARVVQLLDEFANRHKLPVDITQFDVKVDDEEVQADYTRDILTAAFSHPWMSSFTMWGWWAGEHWLPQAAMLRKDWSPKPNYWAYKNRVFKDWFTNVEVKTGNDGTAQVWGFLGQYEVTVEISGKVLKKYMWMNSHWNPVVFVVE